MESKKEELAKKKALLEEFKKRKYEREKCKQVNMVFNIHEYLNIEWCGRVGRAIVLDSEGVGFKSQRSTHTFSKIILNISHYLKCASNIEMN